MHPLAQSIALALGAVSMPVAVAQEDGQPVIEELVVTGIRGSLKNSMDVKRDSQGVVDALSAEDIGKFPDTNLAESLQRITGVSIDRNDFGEGSKVTVRGFGPDFNVVTLNGRQMPNTDLDDTVAAKSRSFDFAQLASEAVSAIEVYKTGKAKLTTGGIGSTINILSTRPLENPGLTASFAAKALVDDSNEADEDDWTPEISGIYSQTFADDTIGVSITGSYAERNGGYRIAEVQSGWNTLVSDGVDADFPGISDFTNPPQAGDIWGWPQDFRYGFNDVQRERTNAQLTLQWEPVESVRATLDYTYSEFEVDQQRQELSAWFGVPVAGEFTSATSDGVVVPVVYTDAACCDMSLGAGDWSRKNELDSLGFNIEWTPSDNLTLAVDYHSSEGEAGSNSPQGSHNALSSAIHNRNLTTINFGPDFGQMEIFSDPNVFPYGDFDVASGADGIIPTGNSFRNGFMKTEIEQLQLDMTWTFDNRFVDSIDFGVALTDIDNRSAYGANQGGDWGGFGSTGQLTGGGWNSPAGDGDANFDNSSFVERNLPAEFDDLSADGVNDVYYDVNFYPFMSDIYDYYAAGGSGGIPAIYANCASGTFCPPEQFQVDRRLNEETTSAYVQANFYWDWGDRPTNLAVGVRYDSTDVTAESLSPNYTSLLWLTANELQLQAEGDGIFIQNSGDYDYWLPNIDFDIEFLENVIFRASYSETITRPNYEDLDAGISVNQQARTDANSGGIAGNTGLKPFESENWDFSVEWYYGDSSYMSAGYYRKDVDNFIGTGVRNEVVYSDLVQPRSGPREQEALDNVVNPANEGLEVLQYYRDQGWVDPVTGELLGSLDSYDPLEFTLTVPSNANDAEIDGFEIALQHVFGDSGFGGIINYTTVDGDIEYDNSTIGLDQFALLGLSDSYNIIAFYDKHGIQARLAYNWRDDFLENTVQGNNQQEPIYVEDYGQLDFNISYTFDGVAFSPDGNLTIFAEGINVTDEKLSKYGRHPLMRVSATQTGERYAFGFRYTF
jgi:TonB-dependent receptor